MKPIPGAPSEAPIPEFPAVGPESDRVQPLHSLPVRDGFSLQVAERLIHLHRSRDDHGRKVVLEANLEIALVVRRIAEEELLRGAALERWLYDRWKISKTDTHKYYNIGTPDTVAYIQERAHRENRYPNWRATWAWIKNSVPESPAGEAEASADAEAGGDEAEPPEPDPFAAIAKERDNLKVQLSAAVQQMRNERARREEIEEQLSAARAERDAALASAATERQRAERLLSELDALKQRHLQTLEPSPPTSPEDGPGPGSWFVPLNQTSLTLQSAKAVLREARLRLRPGRQSKAKDRALVLRAEFVRRCQVASQLDALRVAAESDTEWWNVRADQTPQQITGGSKDDQTTEDRPPEAREQPSEKADAGQSETARSGLDPAPGQGERPTSYFEITIIRSDPGVPVVARVETGVWADWIRMAEQATDRATVDQALTAMASENRAEQEQVAPVLAAFHQAGKLGEQDLAGAHVRDIRVRGLAPEATGAD